MDKFIITFLCVLFSFRGIKIYLRTGLKGEMIRSVGLYLIILSLMFDNIFFAIVGFTICSIGTLILYSFENDKWNENFGFLNMFDRLTGNVQQSLNKSNSLKSYKLMSLITGGLCLLTAAGFYVKIDNNIINTMEVVILFIAGILFIVYYLINKIS